MVTADPDAWFRHRLIGNPSCFVLGLPNFGKSSLVRHMLIGMAARGVLPMILGDLKPDYVKLILAMDGQVISFGSSGSLNVLDPGKAFFAARDALPEPARAAFVADWKTRRLTMLTALVVIARPGQDATVNAVEESLLDGALTLWDEQHPDSPPLIRDIEAIIASGPEPLRQITLDRGQNERYLDATDALRQTLYVLDGHGRFGTMFSEHTTVPMDSHRPVCFDLSSLERSPRDVQAAALMSCWGIGFVTVAAAHALADAGLAPRRNFFLVMDELWRALRAGDGMVDFIDSLTRLNRQEGVGQAMITHTMSDLDALPTEHERAKARGLVERSGMIFAGALPGREMEKLTKVSPMGQVEQDLLSGWADPGTWTKRADAERPGLGKFLIKVGGKPGIPFQLRLTPSEMDLNDTNTKWAMGQGQ
ncbi:hypothetical protein [Acaricomes phytoseiuli]|uniref:hypothetical protein n=1 Tax=Acaricomes phytoseiuli TaxID=291968 RepID=UPI0003720DBC|nr:hypothetical protein [Acaricomes phytoseiuli]